MSTTNLDNSILDTCPDIAQSVFEALQLLHRARRYAEDVKVNVWEFAVGVRWLYALGLMDMELRWLVCKGMVLHSHQRRRSILVVDGLLDITKESCFVLTDQGAQSVVSKTSLFAGDLGQPVQETTRVADEKPFRNETSVLTPVWLPERRQLWIAKHKVKHFRVPAPNQEKILSAFHEENWPDRIFDPLHPNRIIEPKRRLQMAVMCLNRNQKPVSMIKFRGDGTGTGVCWELTQHCKQTAV